jgi:hypothetical protein
MSTILSPIRVTRAPDIDVEELRDGLSSASSGACPELDVLRDEWAAEHADRGDHPALFAWDKVVDAAIAEITPDVAKMLQAAIERRLPWTYQP